MIGNGNNINNVKSSSQQRPQEQQQQKPAVAQVAVSFFQRIISGGSATNQRGNASRVNPESDTIVGTHNNENTVQSVQTLKQFWINAFGSGSAALKRAGNSEKIHRERLNSVNCEQIEVDRGKSTSKSLSLNRDFIVSDSFSKNRISDNFYKYKTADLVKTSRNSGVFQCSEPNLVPFIVPHLQTSETMIITSENRPETISSISVIMSDDKKCQQTDNTTEKASVSSTKSLTLSKSSSGSSIVHNAVSKSRKSGSNVSTRKCSFRTNAYHVKKSANNNTTGNKVAALTHRFNQLIQNDDDIRDDVTRKRKVILHRSGGHVFKVMSDTVDSPSKSKKNSSRKMEVMVVDGSPSKLVKKKLSVRRKNSAKVSVIQQSPQVPVSVKEKIQIFETSDAIPAKTVELPVQKPAVPSKSAHVLRRTHEIVAQNSLKKLQNSTSDVVTLVPNLIQNQNVVSNVVPKIIPNDLPPKKSSVSRIYEKLAIRSTTFLSRKKIYASVASKPIQEIPIVEEEQYESVEKIMDALAVVSQRIEHLSKSESCLLSVDSDEKPQPCSDIIPNPSFLFRTTSKPADVIEAINNSIIKKTKSMDDAHFPSSLRMVPKVETREYGTIFRETDELLQRIKESIQKDDIPKITDSTYEETQASSVDSSSIYQSIFGAESKDSNKPYESSTDSSNIYQSISEAISNDSTIITKTLKTIDSDMVSINSYESFENYEAVDDEMLENIRNENGYEICAPEKDTPPEPPPPRITGSQTLPSDSPEPALPLPKRAFAHFELQKSNSSSSNYEIIKYDKVPPRPPKSITHIVQSTAAALPEPPMLPLERNSSTETEYDGENIYDTIKPIRSEAVTETSGDYESIEVPSPFLRVKRSFKRSPTDSDTGSTLSSDVKTNSLYGTTMNRIDKAVSQSDTADSSSDNSDDWIDMSDGEAENGQKHKFVV